MVNAYFLGPSGSFSEIITKKVLVEKKFSFIDCVSFGEIGEKILKDKNCYGVLPIENSITSDIHENIDFLFKHELKIISEAYLNINLHLIGFRDSTFESIKTVYSHPRAILQCTNFLKKHLYQIIKTQSTSAGRKILLENKNRQEALIGSGEIVRNSREFDILIENIGNDKFNRTRFVFIGRNYNGRGNKASIIFKVLHKPGSLALVLDKIAKNNLNVTKIESRPIPGTNWEYHFWIDIEDQKEVLKEKTIEDIFKKNTLLYTTLGIYQKGEIFES